MKRPSSTFRSLIPFTTSAPIVDTPLQNNFPPESQYQTFAHRLDAFDSDLSNAVPWGVYKPADLLHDDDSDAMPKTRIHRVTSGKLAPSVTEGLAMYTTAYRLYDVLVRLKGSVPSLPRPLRHKRQNAWVGRDGQWLNLVGLYDLRQALENFVNEGQAATKFVLAKPRTSTSAGSHTDASVRLADEIAAVKKGKKMLVVVKNMAYVAFCISIMMKGYLQVPDHVHEIGFDKETVASQTVAPLMKKVKRIRQALQQTAIISPLLALVSEDLTNPSLCPEELLLNMKLLGNDTPPAIRALEDKVWNAILGMVEGRHTSIAAYLHLQTVVKTFLENTTLDPTENGFFGRRYPMSYHKKMSVYTAFPEDPPPHHWPLPPASQSYITHELLDEQQCHQYSSTGNDHPSGLSIGKNSRPSPADQNLPSLFPGAKTDTVSTSRWRPVGTSSGPPASHSNSLQHDVDHENTMEQQESDVEVTGKQAASTSDDSVEQQGAEFEARKTPGPSTIQPGMGQSSDDSAEPEVEARKIPGPSTTQPGTGRSDDLAELEDEVRKTPGPSTAQLGTSQSDDNPAEQQVPEIEASGPQSNHDPQATTSIEGRLQAPKEARLDLSAGVPIDVTESTRRKNPERQTSRPQVTPANNVKTKHKTNQPKNSGRQVGHPLSESILAQVPKDEVIFVDLEDLAPKDEEERLKIMKDVITVVKVEDSSVDLHTDREGHATPSLQLGVRVERCSETETKTRDMELWDGEGRCHQYKPCIHTKEDYAAWFSIYEACVSHNTDTRNLGRPRPKFIDNPQQSLFRCLRQDEYEVLTALEVQKILSSQNIVITQSTGPKIRFDASGIASLNTSLTREIDIQDQSISDKEGDFSVRLRRGTPKDLLECSVAPPETKKSLNALSFPNPLGGIHLSSYATDVRAFFRTERDEHCIRTLPAEDLRFGLVATEGAHHYWHIDSRGEGTFVRVATGKKIWTVAAPVDPSEISSTSIWSVDLDVRMFDWRKWRTEMILLNAGDTLIMRPTTAHAVFTVQDAICHGGHFLPVSCLSNIVFGSTHTFFEGRAITNVDHPSFQSRMNLLVAFFFRTIILGDVEELDIGHIPDLKTVAGLSDFLIFACGIELQNCLCVTSYRPTEDQILIKTLANRSSLKPEEALWKYDVSSMPHETRLHNIASRARVRVILREVFSHIVVMDGAGVVQEPWKFLFFPTLAWFIHALKGYYELSFGEESLAAKELSKEQVPDRNLFYRQLAWTSRCWPELKFRVDHLEQQNTEANNLVYALPPFTILPCNATKGDVEMGNELFMLGMRDGDTSYLSVYASCASDPPLASGLRRKFEEDGGLQAEGHPHKRQRAK